MKEKPVDRQLNCFVSGALAVFLRLSRVTGIAPLRFVKKGTGWRVSIYPCLSIYGYFMVTALFLILIGQINFLKSPYIQNHKNLVVYIVDSTITMVVSGTVVYGAPRQMKSMITYLNTLQKINSELNTQPISWNKKTIGLYIFWAIAAVTFSVADQVSFSYNQIGKGEIQVFVSTAMLSYYCCCWIIQLCQMRFIMITMEVRRSFEAVNNCLRSLLQDVITNSPQPHHHKSVHRLALTYASVCDVVRDVDTCQGLEVLMSLVFLILRLIITPYYFITSLRDLLDPVMDNASKELADILYAVIQLSWSLLYTFILVMVVEPCHLTHLEMSTTRELVSRLMHHTNSNEEPLGMELKLFFKHIVLNEVSYNPLKVTTMSRALVVDILGFITTYLIVVLQL